MNFNFKGSSKQFENLSKIPQKKKLEKVKSSSILKKLENDVEFYSENNIPLQTDEERKNEISEILKKQKNVVIKKNSDQKFILSFNKNLNTKMNAKTSSQKELTTISEITNDITKKNNTNFNMNSIQKPLIMEHNQNEEKLSSKQRIDFIKVILDFKM